MVGGHCIGVDPYYLVYKARELGYHPQIINSGRFVNDSMGGYIAKQLVKRIIELQKDIRTAKVLVMGITFKENVSDIRNSKVVDVIKELQSYFIDVDVVDPYAKPEEVEREYGIKMTEKAGSNYDAVIVAVNHMEYLNLDEDYFRLLTKDKGILVDVKGIFRNKIDKENLYYWSL